MTGGYDDNQLEEYIYQTLAIAIGKDASENWVSISNLKLEPGHGLKNHGSYIYGKKLFIFGR